MFKLWLPVDGADTWNVVLIADPFSQQSVTDLPSKPGFNVKKTFFFLVNLHPG
jgi:hypothetical protein